MTVEVQVTSGVPENRTEKDLTAESQLKLTTNGSTCNVGMHQKKNSSVTTRYDQEPNLITQPASSMSEDKEQAQIYREFLVILLKERQLRQCTLKELWRNSSDCTLREKLAIFCNWTYANVNSRFVLFGISTTVPFCAWFTRVFWEALISQLVIAVIVWSFAYLVFSPQTTGTLCEAEKLDRKLFEQSLLHMNKISKIAEESENNKSGSEIIISASVESAK